MIDRPAPGRMGTGAGRLVGVFVTALGLGVSAFGGPIAHIGAFERTYVRRLKWLTASAFAELVALCQLLPGPTSSQLGFLIGLRRAGPLGALAAFLGFTAPSAILMAAFAAMSPKLSGPLWRHALHGLQLVAVPIVAQALASLFRSLCPDLPRRLIALAAGAALLVAPAPSTQWMVLAGGAIAGLGLYGRRSWLAAGPDPSSTPAAAPPFGALAAGAVFLALFAAAALATLFPPRSLARLLAVFYRCGALVFGGGHVALPLLRDALAPTGWISDDAFLAGYGAAQALPGPLFTFAAYLGAVVAPKGAGVLWAAAALTAFFLPGLLLAGAAERLGRVGRASRWGGAALPGVNAAVVGLLAAAFVNPVASSAVRGPVDLVVAGAAFWLLVGFRASPVVVVAVCLGASLLAGAAFGGV